MLNLNTSKAVRFLDKQQYDLAIIGSGISCSYTLINYFKRLQEQIATNSWQASEPIKIAVLDKSGEFWQGIPYGSRTGKHSLIITSLEEFLPQPERDRFTSWLSDNYSRVLDSLQQRPGVLTAQWLQSYQQAIASGEWDELFVPRYVFGWYLKETVEQLLESVTSQGYLQCDLLDAEVTNMQKLPDSYQVELTTATANSFLRAVKVVLAIGSPPNRMPFVEELKASAKSQFANDVCFIANMYEPEQNANISNIIQALEQGDRADNQTVLVIGSNASAIETIYSLNNLPEATNLIDKFIVISPNGEFPHRIGDRPAASNFVPQTLVELSQYERGNVKAVYYAAGIDEKPEELAAYRRIFAKYNLPNDNLYCGELVESTFNEAQAFQRKLTEIDRSVNKIVLVSDRYHLRRGIWSFQHVLGKDIEIAAYSTPSSPEIADSQWWKHKASRTQVFRETKKISFYVLYYGLLGRDELITHEDINKVTKGEVAKGVDRPCDVVLPQLSTAK